MDGLDVLDEFYEYDCECEVSDDKVNDGKVSDGKVSDGGESDVSCDVRFDLVVVELLECEVEFFFNKIKKNEYM